MKKAVLSALLFFGFCFSSLCQSALFEDKANYPEDLKKVLAVTKNPSLIALGSRFESAYWNSAKLDDITKNKITEITALFYTKGYQTNPHIVSFLNCTMKAMDNCNQNQLLHYFETLYQAIQYQDIPVVNNFFNVSSLFFDKNMFFKSFTNTLAIRGGTFDFKYEGVATGLANPDSAQSPPPVDISNENQEQSTNTLLSEPVQFTADGPVIYVENTDLMLISPYDTLIVRDTKGSLMFSNGMFFGKGGRVFWPAYYKDLKDVYVEFDGYGFNSGNNILTVENVKFYYPGKFEEPIPGNFEFRSVKHNKSNTKYPQFISLDNNIVINNLAANVLYEGAFSLMGRKFVSICLENKPSKLTYSDGKRTFQLLSNNYQFNDSLISANPASLILFLGSDTISHPGVFFTLKTKSAFAQFTREKGEFKTSLFRDSFHGFEFSADVITWDLTKDSIDINMVAAKSQIPAMFKSTNYFNEKDFYSLQGVGMVHPLRTIFGYMKQTNAEILYADEIVKKMKLNANSFNGAMKDLKRRGFIEYNEAAGKIELKDKSMHFMNSFDGKSDFDNLYLPSLSPDNVNATILPDSSNMMKIRGVNRFYISDSSNVFAIPDSGIVKVYQNKDISFDGTLIAGIFEFKGKNFQFHYNDFLVSLTKIDTIKFLNQKKDKTNKSSQRQYLDNHLVYSSGTLYINLPENKSGKVSYAEYPRFDATTGAYVYFTGKEILGGAYDRRIYFKIPPFKTDSVKKADKSALRFAGQFYSGGMFPDFDEQLKVMPDNAMGFVHKTPAEGYDVYNGKGKFFGTITLDHNGLRGEGEIRYQSSTFYANDFIFYQDSVISRGAQAKIKERTDSAAYYPDADIADYEMKWVPKQDSLHVINLQYPFDLYKKKVKLEGSLTITPKGLYGGGLLEIKNEKVIAPKVDFNQKTVVARHAVFNNKLPGYEKPCISVNNAKITFDVYEAFASINPEIKGVPCTSFPLNEYATSIENARWDLTKRMVYMEAEDKEDISKSIFIATNPTYDSLYFNAASATYDINKKLLKMQGVPYIKTADSKVIPDSNKVTVYEDGKLKTFKKAKLIVDTLNNYHYLVKANIDIESKYKYDGNGLYKYANFNSDTFYLPFEHFYLEEELLNRKETNRYTASNGYIDEEVKFHIAPKVLYKGKVKMMGNKKSLHFEGFVRIDIKNKELQTDWIPYKHDGSVDEFILELRSEADDKSKSAQASKKLIPEAGTGDSLMFDGPLQMYCGFYYSYDAGDLYTTLVSKKKDDRDIEVFNAGGHFTYDKPTKSFEVADMRRLDNKTLAGNKYIYNDSSETILCQGSFKLISPDQNFSIIAAGEAKEKVLKHKYSLQSLMSFKMNLPAKALETMARRIDELQTDNPEFKDSLSQEDIAMYMMKLANISGDRAAKAYEKNYIDALDYKPLFRYASELSQGITFADVKLEWSDAYKSWYSVGKLKLANILNMDFNKPVEGAIEIKRTETGEIVSIFIRPSADVWYYISYMPGRLALLSTEDDFNDAVRSKSKGETGTPAIYSFVISDEAEQALFVKDFYKNYFGRDYEQENSRPAQDVKETPVAEPAQETQADELMPVKTKKKKGAKKSAEPAAEDTQPADNQESDMFTPVKSKKKKADKKEPAATEEAPAPVEKATAPAENQEEDMFMPVKEKKKKADKKAKPTVEKSPATEDKTTDSQEEDMVMPVKEKKKKADKKVKPAEEVPEDTPPADSQEDEMTMPVKGKKKKKP